MKVLVAICLIVLITSYCMCVDDEKRLLADFDVHQVQLDFQQMKAKMSNFEQTIQQLTSSGISTFYYQFMYISYTCLAMMPLTYMFGYDAFNIHVWL